MQLSPPYGSALVLHRQPTRRRSQGIVRSQRQGGPKTTGEWQRITRSVMGTLRRLIFEDQTGAASLVCTVQTLPVESRQMYRRFPGAAGNRPE